MKNALYGANGMYWALSIPIVWLGYKQVWLQILFCLVLLQFLSLVVIEFSLTHQRNREFNEKREKEESAKLIVALIESLDKMEVEKKGLTK